MLRDFYPIDFSDWQRRLESNQKNFESGIPIFDSRLRFSSYRYFHAELISGKTVFPTMVAMYGLACLNQYYRSRDDELLRKSQTMLEWLENDIFANRDAPLSARFFMPTYYLTPPWSNAMTLGLYLSLASRLGSKEEAIKLVLKSLLSEVEAGGGVLRFLDDGEVWLEEYPAKKASLVFNGHNFGVIGLFDAMEFMSSSQKKFAVSALKSSLKAANKITMRGGWTYYDLNKKTLSTQAYQKIHVEQMRYLAEVANRVGLPLDGLKSVLVGWDQAEFLSIPFGVKISVGLGRSMRLCERFFYACLRGFK